MTIGFGKFAKGYNQPVDKLPGRAWVTVLAGTTINLCLGCLYAWSVWLKHSPPSRPPTLNLCVFSSSPCS